MLSCLFVKFKASYDLFFLACRLDTSSVSNSLMPSLKITLPAHCLTLSNLRQRGYQRVRARRTRRRTVTSSILLGKMNSSNKRKRKGKKWWKRRKRVIHLFAYYTPRDGCNSFETICAWVYTWVSLSRVDGQTYRLEFQHGGSVENSDHSRLAGFRVGQLNPTGTLWATVGSYVSPSVCLCKLLEKNSLEKKYIEKNSFI